MMPQSTSAIARTSLLWVPSPQNKRSLPDARTSQPQVKSGDVLMPCHQPECTSTVAKASSLVMLSLLYRRDSAQLCVQMQQSHGCQLTNNTCLIAHVQLCIQVEHRLHLHTASMMCLPHHVYAKVSRKCDCTRSSAWMGICTCQDLCVSSMLSSHCKHDSCEPMCMTATATKPEHMQH